MKHEDTLMSVFFKIKGVVDMGNEEEKEVYFIKWVDVSGVSFKELFDKFVAGTPIKRKAWRGYWVYKYGNIEMHTKKGDVINLIDSEDILFTISGIIQDDWEVATNENCDIEVN